MAHYCYVCKRVFSKDEGIAFYNIPKDPKRRMLWGILIRRENIPHYGEICAKHFTPDCFVENGLGGVYLKPTALPTIIDIPPTEGTQTKVRFGSSEFSNRNWSPAANSVTEKIASIHKERERLKRKIALQTKCLEELKKQRFSYTDSSSSERRELGLNFNLSKNLPQDFNKQKKQDLLSNPGRNPETNSVKIKEEPLSESEDGPNQFKIKEEPLSESKDGPKQFDSECNKESTFPDSESDWSDFMAEEDWLETFREDSNDEALCIPIQGGLKMENNSSIQMPLPVIKSVSSLSEMPYLQFPSTPILQKGPVPETLPSGTSPVLQNRTTAPLEKCPRCAVIRNPNEWYDEPIVRISKSTQTAIIDLVDSKTDNDDLENRSTVTVEGSVVKKTEKQTFDSFGTFVAKRLNALGETTGRFLQIQFGTLLYKIERGELVIR